MQQKDHLKDQYDWVVLGDHPAALLSAGLLSKLGYSTLILPMAPSLLANISSTAQCLDPEPSFLMGLGRPESAAGLLGECLSFLGSPVSALKFIRMTDAYLPQALTPRAKIQLFAAHDRWIQEFDRELPSAELPHAKGLVSTVDQIEGVAHTYWKRLPDRIARQPVAPIVKGLRGWRPRPGAGRVDFREGLWRGLKLAGGSTRDWGSLSESWKRRRLPGGAFGPALEAFLYGMTGANDARLTPFDCAHILALGKSGGSFQGGLTAYRQFLLHLAQKWGAQVPRETECRRLFIENGRLIGAQVSHRGKMVSVNGGAIGCASSHLKEFLYYSGQESKAPLKSARAPAGWRFTLALTVHREAIPPGMNRRAIWKDQDAPALEIETADPSDYNLGQPEHQLVFLRTTLPFTQESLTVSYQRLIASRMFRQLCDLFPFLEFHVSKVFPDFRAGVGTEREEFSEMYGFVTPELVPENLRVYADEGAGADSGIENLYVTNGEAYPQFGSFGGTVAAVQAVSAFVRRQTQSQSTGVAGAKESAPPLLWQ
ncbi:MAG: hypothetical protein AB7P04_03710 [Bacteriovoracia bacterium]